MLGPQAVEQWVRCAVREEEGCERVLQNLQGEPVTPRAGTEGTYVDVNSKGCRSCDCAIYDVSSMKTFAVAKHANHAKHALCARCGCVPN